MTRAQKIMVIRHGEKPEGTSPPYGVTTAGEQDVESLLVDGWTRAGALAVLFAPSRGPLQSATLAVPQYVFAAADEDGSASQRPVETVSVVAQKLDLTTNSTYKVGDETDLAAAAMACDGVVLVGWEHKHIPLIANAILGNTTAPQSWPGNRFDMVWVFDLKAGGGVYSFSQVPQLLLAGDLPNPI
ncbi:hypothetical protein [Caballeronia sordidicola]|uniref:hypothetical protein n=1 Tax=Caballeronia sordidicola TaxID=196367 RepID=UPI0004D0018C|nr:hypothetical protein [Caballeronia sordidicola]